MARVAGARVAGARAAWRLAGLDDFRTAGRVLGQTPKGRFELPSVRAFAPKLGRKIVPLAASLSYLAPPLHIA